MIRFVFFDAGETLLSAQPSWSALSAKVLRERGHEVDPEAMQQAWRDVGSHFRRASDEGLRFSLSADASRSFWTALYAELLDQLNIDDPEAPELLYRTFSDPASYRLFPDARPCLESLRGRGLGLGIISNFESWLEELLRQQGILGAFDVVAISGNLGWEKPQPEIFHWAVEQAGVEPAACAHVGDQPFFDAEPAIACGLQGVLLDRFGRYRDIDADYPSISTLADLDATIQQVGGPG